MERRGIRTELGDINRGIAADYELVATLPSRATSTTTPERPSTAKQEPSRATSTTTPERPSTTKQEPSRATSTTTPERPSTAKQEPSTTQSDMQPAPVPQRKRLLQRFSDWWSDDAHKPTPQQPKKGLFSGIREMAAQVAVEHKRRAAEAKAKAAAEAAAESKRQAENAKKAAIAVERERHERLEHETIDRYDKWYADPHEWRPNSDTWVLSAFSKAGIEWHEEWRCRAVRHEREARLAPRQQPDPAPMVKPTPKPSMSVPEKSKPVLNPKLAPTSVAPPAPDPAPMTKQPCPEPPTSEPEEQKQPRRRHRMR
jgi:hypothetical protein